MSLFENDILIWFLPISLLLVLFLFPKAGLLARWKESRVRRQKEFLEDALKHIFDQEQMHESVNFTNLRKALKLTQKQSHQLIQRMTDLSLVSHQQGLLNLTDQGRKIAIQIVRAHRLWERYLADEARIPLAEVHNIAHRREHGFSRAQIDALDASLGHPLQDPHGDPIPDQHGNFRPFVKGIALSNLQKNASFKIVHVEDEPPMAYAQILALGLSLGQDLQVLESNETRLVLSDGIQEYILAPQIAANIFVQSSDKAETTKKDFMPLTNLAVKQKAEIFKLDETCQGFSRRRFLDLGLTPGTEIFPELINSFGDPRAYRVRGTLIALRKDQAALIWVKPLENLTME